MTAPDGHAFSVTDSSSWCDASRTRIDRLVISDRDVFSGKNVRTRASLKMTVLLSEVDSCDGPSMEMDFSMADTAKGDEMTTEHQRSG
jgi:hypothetical protein